LEVEAVLCVASWKSLAVGLFRGLGFEERGWIGDLLGVEMARLLLYKIKEGDLKDVVLRSWILVWVGV
jgi:hypothetical protein